MPRIPRSQRLLSKAESAILAALEVYNKPSFAYREETFAILALNAWELLLKARLAAHHDNNLKCLYVYETRKTKNGSPSKKRYLRRNRSGNAQTISLARAISLLEAAGVALPNQVRKNLDALTEIRDNAIHLLNLNLRLAKQVFEIGTAAVRNFAELSRAWFALDLEKYNLYLMPIAFLPPPGSVSSVPISADEKGLLRFLTDIIDTTEEDPGGLFHVALEVELVLKRSRTSGIATVAITKDPSATKVALTEEDIRKQYPWDYRELTNLLKARYSDFKENHRYHSLRKPLLKNEAFTKPRYLDPGNPRSAKKDFYASAILQEFDKHYSRRLEHLSDQVLAILS